jgi:hypothetical protein
MRLAFCPLVTLLALPLGGCGTIVKDDTQPVAFDSTPTGAYVEIDGTRRGRTPETIPVERDGEDKQVTFSKNGYQSEQFTLEQNLDGGAFVGNLLLWPIAGNIVDALTGKASNYQESVEVQLQRYSEATSDREKEFDGNTTSGSSLIAK